MPLLRPLRDYNEKDVLNLFSFSGQKATTDVINRGTLVQIVQGWRNDIEPTELIGSYGDFQVWNVQAQRYGTPAKVTYFGTGVATGAAAFTGEAPLGITLFDIRELDENLIPLKYNPRKAAELEACISGQTVPIVVRGTFLYSGLTGLTSGTSPLIGGVPIYGGISGLITAQNNAAGTLPKVGIALGGTGVDGSALIRLTIA